MKRLFLTMLGVALMVAPALHAQEMGPTVAKVNVQKIKGAIAKSDADIANAKKNLKAATWIKRGEVFLDANLKPVNGLYATMPETILVTVFGDAPSAEETIQDEVQKVYSYEHFKAYVVDGQVAYYLPVTVVDAQALDKAYEAYAKAYEVDAKSVDKVATGLENVRIQSVDRAAAHYFHGDYAAAADNFRRAYLASAHAASPMIDTTSLYHAGTAGVFAEKHQQAIEDLNKVLELGYEDDGEVYRLKFLAMYGLDQKEPALNVLKEGLSRYPTNADLIDMALRYYAENDGDPSSLIPLVESSIEKNPENPNLHQGLATIYDKLGRSDEAIATIEKAVELAPGSFFPNYYRGLFTIRKADALNEELNNTTITSRAQFDQALASVNTVYADAVAPLEKAFSINPSELSTLELLKNLTFRLRENALMNEKYEKYNALLDSINTAAAQAGQ